LAAQSRRFRTANQESIYRVWFGAA